MNLANDSHLSVAALEVGGELGVLVFCQRDVCEHPMELVGEFVSARLLQPVDHGLLEVHGVGLLVDQALACKETRVMVFA